MLWTRAPKGGAYKLLSLLVMALFVTSLASPGVAVFADKLARAVILALLPAVLAWSGYVQPTDVNPAPAQPATALTALRLLMSVLPAVLLAASVVVAWRYPLTRQRYAEIRLEIARRRRDS